MVTIRYFSGANDKKSTEKYARAAGENCKACAREDERKRKHSYRKLDRNAGADAALGSRRDVEEDDGLSLREDQTKRLGRKVYVYHPVDVTSLLFGALLSSTAFITTASHLRESILLEEIVLRTRPRNLLLKVSLRVTFNLLSHGTSNGSLSLAVDLLSFQSIIILPLMKIYFTIYFIK